MAYEWVKIALMQEVLVFVPVPLLDSLDSLRESSPLKKDSESKFGL